MHVDMDMVLNNYTITHPSDLKSKTDSDSGLLLRSRPNLPPIGFLILFSFNFRSLSHSPFPCLDDDYLVVRVWLDLSRFDSADVGSYFLSADLQSDHRGIKAAPNEDRRVGSILVDHDYMRRNHLGRDGALAWQASLVPSNMRLASSTKTAKAHAKPEIAMPLQSIAKEPEVSLAEGVECLLSLCFGSQERW
ncbi:unnamed protein product [Microthlaspi erraticum]|uniref:Uncharacterized protein n=1 Tax=Microthlaspi erraticum TaxID=1685480 RepID=A0A6D2JY78_9BRAS|nr:unnamed protein product [Microthlaspi erraticum]